MKNKNSFNSILYDLLEENELLTEYARVENPQNTTVVNRRYLRTKLLNPENPDYEKNLEQAKKDNETAIRTNTNAQAQYAWTGKSTMNKGFLNHGFLTSNEQVVPGEIETYRDPLWFYPIQGTNRLGTYIDPQTGKISPEHKDVIERVNKKYGINLDPNERILPIKQDIKTQPNNYKQYIIWRENYFIPWYKAHSKQGSKINNELSNDYNQKLNNKSNDKIEKSVATQVEPEKEYDKSVIEPIVKDFKQSKVRALGDLYVIAFRNNEINATPQQIFNTYLLLYPKIDSQYLRDTTYDHIVAFKHAHPELQGKFESVEDDNKNSWLTRNGDYSVLDKLNNLFRLQKESKETDMTDNKLKVLHEDNVFSSINTNENDFDPSKVSSDVFNDDNEEGSISEKDELKKNKLTKEVLSKINDTLKLNKEVQDILDEIREINNHNDYNIWVVNEEGNTATLASKNAKIFKQNLNLCLSHDDDIEIFKSVKELHDWLRDHNYPMPKNIQLHESVSVKEDLGSQFSGLRNWLDNLKNESAGLEEDFCCGSMGDTTGASLGTALQYIYKNKKKTESFGKEEFLNKLKALKEDDTDVASNFDSAVQADAGFGSDNSSSDMSTDTSSDLNSGMNSNQDDTVDLGQDQTGEDPSSGFGDINIGGYGPDSGNPEEDPMDMSLPEEQYQIIDVLSDKEDNIRVKVKNLESGEVEYKDLSEIDI